MGVTCIEAETQAVLNNRLEQRFGKSVSFLRHVFSLIIAESFLLSLS